MGQIIRYPAYIKTEEGGQKKSKKRSLVMRNLTGFEEWSWLGKDSRLRLFVYQLLPLFSGAAKKRETQAYV